MKLTGAYGGLQLNIDKDEKIKNLSKLDNNLKKTQGEKTTFVGVAKFDALTVQNLEQTKYYQTMISQNQEAYDYLEELENFFNKNTNNYEENIEFKSQLNKILNNKNFKENELLREFSLEDLLSNKELSSLEKEKIINDLLIKISVKKNALKENMKSYKDEIMKIKLAHENIKAASSNIDDFEKIPDVLSNIKNEIELNGLDLQNKASQARIANILKD